MSIGICYFCKVRLRKNEGYRYPIYQKFGYPIKARICDNCKIKRDLEYKNKYDR